MHASFESSAGVVSTELCVGAVRRGVEVRKVRTPLHRGRGVKGEFAETVAEGVVLLREEVIAERVGEVVEGGRVEGTAPMEIGLRTHQGMILKAGAPVGVEGGI